MDMLQANMAARMAVLSSGVEMTQNIFTATVTPASSPVLNVVPRNVGLIKGFIVQLDVTVANAGASAASFSDWGIANLLSNITFTDLNNNQRVNTSGWHLVGINAVKARRPFGSATLCDSPMDFGNSFNVVRSQAVNVPAGGSTVVRMMYHVPLAYSDSDLRGAVYANVVNATMNLALSFNAAPGFVAGTSTLAVAGGASTVVTLSTATVNVYQIYLDQLPIGQNGPIVPMLDVATVYELKNTALTGITSGQDFPVAYANFRNFLSTFAIYDNGGTRADGTDINTWSLQTANYTNIFRITPEISALRTRGILNCDVPTGSYYFDYRGKPLSTVQYGNMQLVMNARGTVNAGANLLVGFEAFANVNTVVGAGSLATG